jgi:hypothetical protein
MKCYIGLWKHVMHTVLITIQNDTVEFFFLHCTLHNYTLVGTQQTICLANSNKVSSIVCVDICPTQNDNNRV